MSGVTGREGCKQRGGNVVQKIYNNRRQLKLDFHWVVMKKPGSLSSEEEMTLCRERETETNGEDGGKGRK